MSARIHTLAAHIPQHRFDDAAAELHEALIVLLATGETRDFEPALAEARALVHLSQSPVMPSTDERVEAARLILALRAGCAFLPDQHRVG